MVTTRIIVAFSLALSAWQAAAQSVKTTMASAEIVIPDVAPMQAIEVVQDAMSGWIGQAPISLKPIPEHLPARPGTPSAARLNLGGTPAEILDCSAAVAEVRKESASTRQRMAFNGDFFQACVYPFAKGAKVYLRAVNVDAADSSITHGLFSGINKAIRGTPGEWLARRLNDFIEAMKKKLPVVLVERIEAPGLPVQAPDRDAVATFLPVEAAPPMALAASVATPDAPTLLPAAPVSGTTLMPDRTSQKIEARKNLTAMGLTYHSQPQFLDAVQRKDALAVKLFLDGGGVDPGAKGADGKSAVDLAHEVGAADIVALLDTPTAPQPSAPSAPTPRLPPGAVPAGTLMPQLSPEQQAQMRQQLLEAIRQQRQ